MPSAAAAAAASFHDKGAERIQQELVLALHPECHIELLPQDAEEQENGYEEEMV